MEDATLRNLVSAFSLATADAITRRADAHAPRDDPARAIAFVGRTPGMTIRQLSGKLSLSHAATARLVDRLSEDGIVTSNTSTNDRRSVCLRLTSLGKTVFHAILSEQSEVTRALLNTLTPEEQKALGGLLAKMMRATEQMKSSATISCRFCNPDGCLPCPLEPCGMES